VGRSARSRPWRVVAPTAGWRSSIGLDLWLVLPEGAVSEIARQATARFAVDPDRGLLAYGTARELDTPAYYRPRFI
jgi:hypothetical protein